LPPRAMSSPIDPVEMPRISWIELAPRAMMAPLPNSFSIWARVFFSSLLWSAMLAPVNEGEWVRPPCGPLSWSDVHSEQMLSYPRYRQSPRLAAGIFPVCGWGVNEESEKSTRSVRLQVQGQFGQHELVEANTFRFRLAGQGRVQ